MQQSIRDDSTVFNLHVLLRNHVSIVDRLISRRQLVLPSPEFTEIQTITYTIQTDTSPWIRDRRCETRDRGFLSLSLFPPLLPEREREKEKTLTLR